MTECEPLASIDALIVRAESARRMSPLSAQRNAELLYQHGELLTALRTLRAFTDGQTELISVLSERVNALASLYSETSPGSGEWVIRPKMATRFKGALFALLNLVRDLLARKGESENGKG